MENDVAGLQVKHNHKWVAVPHVPGSFVVNIGDYRGILSNGRYKSVEHRAVVNAERPRISIRVSLGPEMTAIVAPAAQLLDEESEMKYKPITYKDYMRFQQSKVMREGKSPLQALMSNNTSESVSSTTPPLS
ncbi:unnamed protein product [Camellia sinensis]